MSVLDEAQLRKNIRKEVRAANSELRATLKKIPWR